MVFPDPALSIVFVSYCKSLQESVKMMVSESDDDKMRAERRLEAKVKVSPGKSCKRQVLLFDAL